MRTYLLETKRNIDTQTRHKLSIIPEIMAGAVSNFKTAFAKLTLAEYSDLPELLCLAAKYLPSFPARIASFKLILFLQVSLLSIPSQVLFSLIITAQVRSFLPSMIPL